MNYGKFNENDEQVFRHFSEVLFPLSVLFSRSNRLISARVLKLLQQAAGLAPHVCLRFLFFSELMNAGQTAGALGLRPGLILTLLAVSR